MSEHCPGCCKFTVRMEARQGSGESVYAVPVYDVPCPGLQCAACAAKDAEIARLTAALDVADEMADYMDGCRYVGHGHALPRTEDGMSEFDEVKAEQDNLLGLYEQYIDALTQMVRVEREADTLRAALQQCVEAAAPYRNHPHALITPFADALAHAQEVLDGR